MEILAFGGHASLLEADLNVADRTDELWMRKALAEAHGARQAGEVPVGTVIVHEGGIIGRGHNQREMLKDPTAHAEMIAIARQRMMIGSVAPRIQSAVTIRPMIMR